MHANIKFNYLYRDAGNYKQFGNIILSNPNNISIDLVTDIVRKNLIDGEFFEAGKWGVPSLFFDTKNESDHNDRDNMLGKLWCVFMFNVFQETFEEITYVTHKIFIHKKDNYSMSPIQLLLVYNIIMVIMRFNASNVLTHIPHKVHPFFFSIFTFFKIYTSVMIIITVPKQGQQLLLWSLVISVGVLYRLLHLLKIF